MPPWLDEGPEHGEPVTPSNVVQMNVGKRPPSPHGGLLHLGDHVELGRGLVARLRAGSETVFTSGGWWRFDGGRGVWTEFRREEVDGMTIGYSGSKVNGEKKALKMRASDVNGVRKVAEVIADSPGHFDEALPGIAFSNGFALVSNDGVRMVGHASAHRARHAYPFAFAERDDCRFRSFLVDCFEGDEDADAKIQIIREFIGACIIGKATQFQLALVMKGEGSNGKGVCMSAIEKCMPENSVVAIPPQRMGDQYYRARIAAKLLNVVSELPEADIIDSESFKAVISGDTIEARNPTEKPFSHRPIAGHIYACNRLPGTTDQSEGFWRRFVVMNFGRKFEVNAGFSAGIVEDFAATVCWALTGVPELMKRGRYEPPPSSATMKREWRLSSDQVALFLDEGYEAASDEWIKAKDLYGTYKAWASENGHRAMAANKFGERMGLLGHKPHKMNFGNVYHVKRKPGALTEDKPWSWNG